MRAQQHAATQPITADGAAAVKVNALPRLWLALGGAVLTAYAAGVAWGRGGGAQLAADMAAYYMDKQSYAVYGAVLLRLAAAAFLQLTAILICGLHIFGAALPVIFMAAQGALCGVCAAGVSAYGGAKALVVYWLISLLPTVSGLLLMLWLGSSACRTGLLMLELAGGAAQRGSLPKMIKMAVKRYIISLAAALACSVIGALLAVFFAAVLL